MFDAWWWALLEGRRGGRETGGHKVRESEEYKDRVALAAMWYQWYSE